MDMHIPAEPAIDTKSKSKLCVSSLRDLRKECVAAFRASSKAEEVASKESSRVRKLHPPCPESVLVEYDGPGGQRYQRPATAEDFAPFVEQGSLTAGEVEKRLADLHEWEAACDAIDAQHPKVRELKDAQKAADDRWLELDDQFVAAPAQTLEDIGIKLKFLTVMGDMHDRDDDLEGRTVFGLIRDIERMMGAKI